MQTTHPAPKPAILPIYDDPTYRLHWYDRPGAPWTPDKLLAGTIRELTVHWTEENTPAGLTIPQYQAILAKEAHYHAFERNWNDDPNGPFQGGDGLMYHYAITPTGIIFQTTPETKRTWNAYSANAWNLAVVIMAGHGDPISVKAQRALTALLAWFTTARADLPGITAHPQQVALVTPAGPAKAMQTYGVLTHDESLIRQGRPPKGCCGQYAPTVKTWRAAQAT
jgi:N-acetylmuramoyl-L-alanine amidase